MQIRLPDAPETYSRSWAASLVAGLTNMLRGLDQPAALPGYTVAKLPSPGSYEGVLVRVTNGSSNRHLAISDGTNWRYPDGAIVT